MCDLMYSVRLEQSLAVISATCGLHVAAAGLAVPVAGQPAIRHAAWRCRLPRLVHDPRSQQLPAGPAPLSAALKPTSQSGSHVHGWRSRPATWRPALAATATAPEATDAPIARRRRPFSAGPAPPVTAPAENDGSTTWHARHA